jgi:hypothetical protein
MPLSGWSAAVSDATDVVQHSLVVVVGLTFTTDLCLLVEYHGGDAFFLQPSRGCQASWACANDANWRLFMAAVRPSRGCQGEGEQRKNERPPGSTLHDGEESIGGREKAAEHGQVIGTARAAPTLPLPRRGPRAARCVGSDPANSRVGLPPQHARRSGSLKEARRSRGACLGRHMGRGEVVRRRRVPTL